MKNKEDKSCRRCSERCPETLTHVLQHCRYHLSNQITDRHNAVLQRIVQGIRHGPKKKCELIIDQKVAAHTGQRPDIVLIDEKNKEVVITDVCCPMENGLAAMKKAVERKIEKYRGIAAGYEMKGFSVKQLPIAVGSLGSWYKESEKALKELGISKSYATRMTELNQATVIEHSKNIYYKHIYGDQFKILPLYLPCLSFRGAKWTKVDFETVEKEDEPLFTSEDVILQ